MQLSNLKNCKLALFKYVQSAWYCESKKNELNGYELLSLLYFKEGDMKKSEYYHDRALLGVVEGTILFQNIK